MVKLMIWIVAAIIIAALVVGSQLLIAAAVQFVWNELAVRAGAVPIGLFPAWLIGIVLFWLFGGKKAVVSIRR